MPQYALRMLCQHVCLVLPTQFIDTGQACTRLMLNLSRMSAAEHVYPSGNGRSVWKALETACMVVAIGKLHQHFCWLLLIMYMAMPAMLHQCFLADFPKWLRMGWNLYDMHVCIGLCSGQIARARCAMSYSDCAVVAACLLQQPACPQDAQLYSRFERNEELALLHKAFWVSNSSVQEWHRPRWWYVRALSIALAYSLVACEVQHLAAADLGSSACFPLTLAERFTLLRVPLDEHAQCWQIQMLYLHLNNQCGGCLLFWRSSSSALKTYSPTKEAAMPSLVTILQAPEISQHCHLIMLGPCGQNAHIASIYVLMSWSTSDCWSCLYLANFFASLSTDWMLMTNAKGLVSQASFYTSSATKHHLTSKVV